MITKERLSSFWFWWLILTLIYLVLGTFGFQGSIEFARFVGFIGLFVPFGYISIMMLAIPITWLSVPVFFISGYYFSKWLNKQDYSVGKKIILIILALLVLTTITDFARATPLASWSIFINGGLRI